ncbi:D12 class N6 adenine-specific DNA methyltransferase [Spirochaeta thermophila DSM 6578]|uniref:site-specific DNA-methyltransferase (adenine-specific) n=1 Tax=Winmispira thermophila (strain ATCC 700085 / DSM 6578 / Z-1203) TaxID=869211 RepID=G0GCL8_WINT7|nr:DNA adenine methylase [Spirochaeta thermophila]AEJ62084.1 D12 class N6 adenine-specific DNA methyltransferase [Spirochaeta thermophila DSM 6578]
MRTSPSTFRTGIRSHPYLNHQLLAYIGNKRSLLPFLARIFHKVRARTGARTFLDPFAGTGVVSRLARILGIEVTAGDWEFYAYLVNKAYLEIDASELPLLYRHLGGIEEVLSVLNRRGAGEYPRAPYISRYYAPRSLEDADPSSERLFYTPYNARFIDVVRETIEEWYPGWDLPDPAGKEKALLVALLLYGAAKHANTSGLFKAFHRGFGGHGRDALTRILAPIRIPPPVLLEHGPSARTFCEDAFSLVSRIEADLCYLDPPYTIHQYGSNYFMLNTIALWDRPPVSEERDREGKLVHKAGIRSDWKRTWSPFCSRRYAEEAMEALVAQVRAPVLLVSYNTDGIIPCERLVDILSLHGSVEVEVANHTAYRGGRQSIYRKTGTVEYVCILTRGKPASPELRRSLRHALAVKEVEALLSRGFRPALLSRLFRLEGDLLHLSPSLPPVKTIAGYLPQGAPPGLERCSLEELESMRADLSLAACTDKEEEFYVALSILPRLSYRKEVRLLSKRVVWLLSKFAFKKYQCEFSRAVCHLQHLLASSPGAYPLIERDLPRLLERARRRMGKMERQE